MAREALWLPGGVRMEVHLDGAATGGAFCLLVDEPPPGWWLPPHRHRAESETIHVVAGEFDVVVDGERMRLGPGDTAHVPVGVLHEGGNVGSEPGRRLLVFSPSGPEGFFREIGTGDPDAVADRAAMAAAGARYGFDFQR